MGVLDPPDGWIGDRRGAGAGGGGLGPLCADPESWDPGAREERVRVRVDAKGVYGME